MPRIRETRTYVRKVLRYYETFWAPRHGVKVPAGTRR